MINLIKHRFEPRFKQKHLWQLIVFGFALLFCFLARDALNIWTYANRAKLSCQADTVLVMGAAQYNGVPSPAFKRRLDKALELYKQGCASQVVVTGGKQAGDVISEGEAGVKYLQEKGIAQKALLSETKSTTSYQNILNSEALIPDKELTIVTDDLHAYRARYLAKQLGYAVEVATVITSGQRFNYFLREWRILMAYHLGFVR